MILTKLTAQARALLAYTPLQYMLDTATEHPHLARCLVDDQDAPTACALLLGHSLFIGGDAGEGFLTSLLETMFTPEMRARVKGVGLGFERESTMEFFRARFPKHWLHGCNLYRHMPGAPETPAPYPGVLPIDRALLASGAENLRMIEGEVLGTATYADMQDFSARGFGYTYAPEGAIRGFCTSEYQSRDAVAIGIEVSEPYQRRGVARAMTRHFLAEAFRRGLCVYWDCDEGNAGSNATALACGFTLFASYPSLLCWF